MKKFLLHLFLVIWLNVNLLSQENISITIQVIANNVPNESTLYVTGNDVKIGNWQPDLVKLIETKNGIWTKNIYFPKGKKLEFKITRGTWDTEAVNDDGSIPSNNTIDLLNDTTVSIEVNLWADMIEQKIEGGITGIVKYHLDFRGKGIKPRNIIVWLPPYYFIETDKRYPVLYMHDGQNIVDPRTAAFKVDWQIDEAADSLIRQGLIEDIIVVGIYNTPQRTNEYSENDTGYAYMNFLVDSLKPFIDNNYRTLSEKDYTSTGGSSLGGLISFMLVWEFSDIFSKALCFSPALKIDKYNFVENVKSYKGKIKDIKVYIYNGCNELDTRLQPGVDEMISELENLGFVEEKDFYFYQDQDAMHGESSWAKNIPRALIYLFGTQKGRELL